MSVCDGKFFHVRCGNHNLNLIVKADLEKADEAIEKVREGIKHIKHSEGRILKFVECIKNHGLSCSKKLRQDVTTRWNSTYQMLDSSLLYQQAYIQYKLLDIDFKYSLSEEEWKRVENLMTADAKVEKVVDHLQLLFREYLRPSTIISLLWENIFDTNNKETRDDLEKFDVFENQLESGGDKTQLDLYLEEPKLDRKVNPNLNVLAYWKENRGTYPELSLMERDILSILITTVALESTFSIGGRIIGKFQSSILPANVESKLCAKDCLCGQEDCDGSDTDEDEIAV